MSRLYLLRAEDTNRYKIGFTSGSVKKRVGSIQTSSPFPIIILAEKEGTVTDERELHRKLSKYRRVGEWFEFHSPDLALRCFKFGRYAKPPETPDQKLERVATQLSVKYLSKFMMMSPAMFKRMVDTKKPKSNLWYILAMHYIETKELPDERALHRVLVDQLETNACLQG